MIHKKVQCWIFSQADQKEYCLLLKTNPSRGSFWQPVTGSVEQNEGYFEGACREASEETGFVFNSVPKDTGYEFEFVSRFGPTKERIFAMCADDLPTPKLDPKEHQDFQWAEPLRALELLRYPSNLEGLRRSYKLIFGKDLRK